jgi:hypothetical protein
MVNVEPEYTATGKETVRAKSSQKYFVIVSNRGVTFGDD